METLLDALARGDVARAALADESIHELLRSERVDARSRAAMEALRDAYAVAIERCTVLRDRSAEEVARRRRERTAAGAYLRHSVT